MGRAVNISSDVAKRLKIILNKYTYGMPVESVLYIYKSQYPKNINDLDWTKTGHINLDSFLASSPEGTFKREINSGNRYLYYGYDSPNEPEQLVEFKKMKDKINKHRTGTHAKRHEDFKILRLESMWDRSHRLRVKIGEVYSPEFFWLIPAVDDKFDKFRAKMKKFYLEPGIDTRLVKNSDLRLNLPCVVFLTDNTIHRVIITSILTHSIEVFFVDYGNVGHMKAEGIFYLDRKFFDFPAQAFMGSLCGIEARRCAGQWDDKASTRFMSITDDKRLEAEYACIEKDVLKILLRDLDDPGNRTINERMVYEEYADFIIPKRKPKSQSLKRDNVEIERKELVVESSSIEEETCADASPVAQVKQADQVTGAKDENFALSLMIQDYSEEATTAMQKCIEGFLEQRNFLVGRIYKKKDPVLQVFSDSVQKTIKNLEHIKSYFEPKFNGISSDHGACSST